MSDDQSREANLAWVDLMETRKQIESLRQKEDDLILELVNLMPGKKFETSLGYTIEKTRSMSRKWDGPALVRSVATRAAEYAVRGEETGEPLPEPLPEIVGAITANLNRTLAISYGRMGELSSFGIDPDEYSEKAWGRWTVRPSKTDATTVPAKPS